MNKIFRLTLLIVFALLASNSFAQNLGEFHISNRLDGRFLRNDTKNGNHLIRTFEQDEYTKWTLFKKANGHYQLFNHGKALGLVKWQGKYRYEMMDKMSENAEWRIINHDKLGVTIQHVRTGLFPVKKYISDIHWELIFESKKDHNTVYWTYVFLSAQKQTKISSTSDLFDGAYQVWVSDPVNWRRGRLSSKMKKENVYEPIITKEMFGARAHWKFENAGNNGVRLHDLSWNQYLDVKDGKLTLSKSSSNDASIWDVIQEGGQIVGLRNRSNQKYLGLSDDGNLELLKHNSGRVFLRKAHQDMTTYFFDNYCILIEQAYKLVPSESEIQASEPSEKQINLVGDGFEMRRLKNESGRMIWWMNKNFAGVHLEVNEEDGYSLINVGEGKYLKIPHEGGVVKISTDSAVSFKDWKEVKLK